MLLHYAENLKLFKLQIFERIFCFTFQLFSPRERLLSIANCIPPAGTTIFMDIFFINIFLFFYYFYRKSGIRHFLVEHESIFIDKYLFYSSTCSGIIHSIILIDGAICLLNNSCKFFPLLVMLVLVGV